MFFFSNIEVCMANDLSDVHYCLNWSDITVTHEKQKVVQIK